MLLNITKLQSQLILEEGMRLMAYDDKTGYPVPSGGKCQGNLTVGVGHNLDANPLTSSELAAVGHDGRTQPITHDNALMILGNDIDAICDDLDYHLPWWSEADEIRERVLADLAFNMGIHKLMVFSTFLRLMQQQQYAQAADDLQATPWYGQVHTRGPRLVGMIRTGEDYTA